MKYKEFTLSLEDGTSYVQQPHISKQNCTYTNAPRPLVTTEVLEILLYSYCFCGEGKHRDRIVELFPLWIWSTKMKLFYYRYNVCRRSLAIRKGLCYKCKRTTFVLRLLNRIISKNLSFVCWKIN